MKRSHLVFIAALVVLGALLFAYAAYRGHISGAFDTRLQKALEAVQNPHSYEMTVDTATSISGRKLDITGDYALDLDKKRYGSYGTTTLTIPDAPPKKRVHTFTLSNISVGTDVYVKIGTNSSLLKKNIPYGPNWRHFKTHAVPPQFIDIAVVGPVLDNLELLGENGRYLSLTGQPADRALSGRIFHVYSFKLSQQGVDVTGGTLKLLIDHIATGTVQLWIDDDSSIHRMIISSNNYVSTTTILHVNTPLTITEPVSTE